MLLQFLMLAAFGDGRKRVAHRAPAYGDGPSPPTEALVLRISPRLTARTGEKNTVNLVLVFTLCLGFCLIIICHGKRWVRQQLVSRWYASKWCGTHIMLDRSFQDALLLACATHGRWIHRGILDIQAIQCVSYVVHIQHTPSTVDLVLRQGRFLHKYRKGDGFSFGNFGRTNELCS